MRYQYQALDEQGQAVSGVLSVDSEREAIRQLQKRGLTPLTVTETATERKIAQQRSKPKQRDILTVLHELTTLLQSGIALIDAVESLAESSHHPHIVAEFVTMGRKLRQGQAFSVTLRDSDLKLPWYIYQLVEAGELTGKVAEALQDGVAQLEYDLRVANELRNALIYPAILVFSGIGAVLLIFIVVVPRFANILNTRGDELPWLASAVLNTGMFFNAYWWGVMAVIGLLVFALGYVLRQRAVRAKLADNLARLPGIGVWLIEAETGRWAAMMGTLLENRVALLRALELAEQGVQLPTLQARLTQVSKAVRAGTPLSEALQDNEALTATGHNLIRAGEKSGELPRMLRSLAKLLEESGRLRMKRALLLIEPLAILIIGSVIGVIITGVILAITSVNQIGL